MCDEPESCDHRLPQQNHPAEISAESSRRIIQEYHSKYGRITHTIWHAFVTLESVNVGPLLCTQPHYVPLDNINVCNPHKMTNRKNPPAASFSRIVEQSHAADHTIRPQYHTAYNSITWRPSGVFERQNRRMIDSCGVAANATGRVRGKTRDGKKKTEVQEKKQNKTKQKKTHRDDVHVYLAPLWTGRNIMNVHTLISIQDLQVSLQSVEGSTWYIFLGLFKKK